MAANHRPAATHCLRGHPLSGDNIKVRLDRSGYLQRSCVACRAIRDAAKKEEVAALTPRRPQLDEKQLRRLLDAHEDGVSKTDLSERFGVSNHAELCALLDEARMLARRAG